MLSTSYWTNPSVWPSHRTLKTKRQKQNCLSELDTAGFIFGFLWGYKVLLPHMVHWLQTNNHQFISNRGWMLGNVCKQWMLKGTAMAELWNSAWCLSFILYLFWRREFKQMLMMIEAQEWQVKLTDVLYQRPNIKHHCMQTLRNSSFQGNYLWFLSVFTNPMVMA